MVIVLKYGGDGKCSGDSEHGRDGRCEVGRCGGVNGRQSDG